MIPSENSLRQGRFKEMLSENSSKEELLQLKARIKRRCELF
jgi:hypothetical protein